MEWLLSGSLESTAETREPGGLGGELELKVTSQKRLPTPSWVLK